MDTGNDLAATLQNYEIQLQQVVAALAEDSQASDRDDLLKLKIDLEEVIKLTKDLMTGGTSKSSSNSGGSNNYRAGDKVLAPWSEDGMYYEALLEEVMSDGQCNVTFCDPNLGATEEEGPSRKRKAGISEVCLVSLLKPCSSNDGSFSYKKPSQPGYAKSQDNKGKSKTLSRDDLKKKQQKRLQKVKDLEEEREKDKNKWQQFNQFNKKGKKKGLTTTAGSNKRVSIFASPDGVDGRVGIGTCGISGKGMTPYMPSSSVTANSQVALHHSSFQKKKQLQAGLAKK
ncbi:Survival of motor neuron-related-splicing factor 30 [Halotydeus destructor]|nr:Survival of motor neuron-related-splicing factor 30 [Halotydeus destructor]